MAQVKLFQEDRSVHGTSHIVSRGPQCPWHKSHCFKRTAWPWHKSHCFKRTAVSLAKATLFQEDRSDHSISHIVSRGPNENTTEWARKAEFLQNRIPDSRWCMKSYIPTCTMPRMRDPLIALDSHKQLATWSSMLSKPCGLCHGETQYKNIATSHKQVYNVLALKY